MSQEPAKKNCPLCKEDYLASLDEESDDYSAGTGQPPCCPKCSKAELDQRVEVALQESVSKLYSLLARRQQNQHK